MRYTLHAAFFLSLLLICSCALFDSQQAGTSQNAHPGGLAVPLGKNWQLVEEPPVITDGRLPFQMEQSVQPEGARPVMPGENIKIETPQ